MPTFQSKKFVPKSFQNTFAASYRSSLSRHPFLLFGLPFIATMVAGSFFLTPAAALRYERHDRKIKTLSKDEELGLKRIEGRKAFDINEEYYRLAAKDLDDWDNKRMEESRHTSGFEENFDKVGDSEEQWNAMTGHDASVLPSYLLSDCSFQTSLAHTLLLFTPQPRKRPTQLLRNTILNP
ncbi:MAG: hypothetical protein Q9176_002374 [Flavoplaca citrina]